jgi:hypothetical protein
MRNGWAACRATGAEGNITAFIALLVRACEIAGQIEEAMTHLNSALQIAERTGERWLMAELYRHKGQLLPRKGDPRPLRNCIAKPWSSPRSKKPSSGNRALQRASLGSPATRAGAPKPTTSSHLSPAGSPRASIHPI